MDDIEEAMDELNRRHAAVQAAYHAVWTMRGSLTEGTAFLAEMLREPRQDDPEVVAEVEHGRGWVAEATRDLELAKREFQLAFAALRASINDFPPKEGESRG
jgi:ribosomal 50S subunit-associated protein YjgA (DUF615 family)